MDRWVFVSFLSRLTGESSLGSFQRQMMNDPKQDIKGGSEDDESTEEDRGRTLQGVTFLYYRRHMKRVTAGYIIAGRYKQRMTGCYIR